MILPVFGRNRSSLAGLNQVRPFHSSMIPESSLKTCYFSDFPDKSEPGQPKYGSQSSVALVLILNVGLRHDCFPAQVMHDNRPNSSLAADSLDNCAVIISSGFSGRAKVLQKLSLKNYQKVS
jgi:hypothetical protein